MLNNTIIFLQNCHKNCEGEVSLPLQIWLTKLFFIKLINIQY